MPKRYVELETLINTVKATPRCDLAMALMIANNYATADVEERKRGEWKEITTHNGCTPDYDCVCSLCGESGLPYENYCSNCGAKMKEGE